MSKPSILIVDTDSDLSDILSKRFSDSGWVVKSAKDLSQTNKEIEKKQFDVILVDPETDVDAAVFLAALEKNKNAKDSIKIIHTSATDRSTVEEFEKTGADFLWLKGSVSLTDIVKKTKTFFESRKK